MSSNEAFEIETNGIVRDALPSQQVEDTGFVYEFRIGTTFSHSTTSALAGFWILSPNIHT